MKNIIANAVSNGVTKIAQNSADAASFLWLHQPKAPKSLKK